MDGSHRNITTLNKKAVRAVNVASDDKQTVLPKPNQFLKKCFLAILIVLAAAFYITAYVRNFERMADPHNRSFTEFRRVFNEAMVSQGIAVGEDTQWDTYDVWYETTYCVVTLPDGGELPCYIELWGNSISKTPIMLIEIGFTKEQAEYVVPVVQGVFDVFLPEPNEQSKVYINQVLEACKIPFSLQAYEKHWERQPYNEFTLTLDDTGLVTAQWYFFPTE
ncbi:MAG TPA: hypothetical protein PKB13_05700 [Clostridia bacterium]|nr:hypothetical protein [Clostridia bacterium]